MGPPDASELPILPPELERKIFELAVVLEHPSSALPLMLVAHRTHRWIASVLYNIANQLSKIYPAKRGDPSKPDLTYYGPFVKHIILGGDMKAEKISMFFSSCPNLIDVALWSHCRTKAFLGFFDDMKLERLSTNISTLDPEDFQTSALSNITHLDITKFGSGWPRWKDLTVLPRLTHLAINEVVDVDIIRRLLHHCKQLQILLLVEVGTAWNMGDIFISDPRLVMMKLCRYVVEDWRDSALGKENMWSWAEEISLAKQRGLFKDETLLCTWFGEKGWRRQLGDLCHDTN
ncbi:hypothetical protein BDZ97DRAFT_1811166 [Flammula alnicola]|nr:hypothetical protein BDZ97DRAFT_1811166 [Flammula alnicola]